MTSSSHEPVHKEICIEFSVGGRDYEAVGFLNAGEENVLGTTALERTNVDGLVIGQEDFGFIWVHHKDLPEKLKMYVLLTNTLHPEQSRNIRFFVWLGMRWGHHRDWIANLWGNNILVIRRRV